MSQVLAALASHSLALVVYPGLVTIAAFGAVAEVAWARLRHGVWVTPGRELPSPVAATVALLCMLVAVQLAAPFNPVPSVERNVIVAAVVLAFTIWVELALTTDVLPAPGLLLVVQFCWLVAVLGPAVQPESLRPQVLGNVLVSSLLPVKVGTGFLYLLCLPALLRLWPLTGAADRRSLPRFDTLRALSWLPYCGLFTTLFFPPSGDDLLGLLRFFAISLGVAALCIVAGWLMVRRGADAARGLYGRAVAPYAAVVLVVVVVTSFLMR
jgi:hypothetical protein